MEHVWLWARFAIASALIVLAAGRLTRYADVISEKLKLGHVFVGMIFLGWVTSLPELVLSLSSTIYVGEPDLAIGNVLGSCLFNLLILVVVEVVFLAGLLFGRTGPSAARTGAASLVMLLLALFGMQAGMARTVPAWLHAPFGLPLDIFSWLIILCYLASTVILYRLDRKSRKLDEAPPEAQRHEGASLALTGLASFAAALVIVGAGFWLAYIGDEIADEYDIARSFVGVLFFAVVSSLPELSTSIAAARMGFYDMVFGNIFGSNIFNVMIIGISDIAYQPGSIMASSQTSNRVHLWVAMLAAVATLAAIAGVRRRTGRLFWRISWISLVIVACYAAGLASTYLL